MQFKISKELIVQIEQLIKSKDDHQLESLLNDLHHADIAEILDELDFNEATYSNAPQWAPSSPPIPDGFLDVFPLIVLPTPG